MTRGLSTAIVEARDWASGTSSRSSKLIHGGLRYLEMLDFALVHEALHERGLLLDRLAPHLVRPVPFLYPLQHRPGNGPTSAPESLLYDSDGPRPARPGVPHHNTSAGGARSRGALPQAEALTGAVQYWDAQVDDARHTMTVVRTAVSFGALAANRAKVVAFLRQGEPGHRRGGGPGDRRNLPSAPSR